MPTRWVICTQCKQTLPTDSALLISLDIKRRTLYHVCLPAFHVDTAINAPPEVIFWFTFPGKNRNTFKGQKINKNWVQNTWANRTRLELVVQTTVRWAVYRSLPKLRPLHSEWSKCYMQSSDTEHPVLQVSRSGPERNQHSLSKSWDGKLRVTKCVFTFIHCEHCDLFIWK